jgi:PAS domain S-box-containing protein
MKAGFFQPGLTSPVLGADSSKSFHLARTFSGAVGFAVFLTLSFIYGRGEGWLVLALFSLAVAGHGRIRQDQPERSITISLLIDLLWVATVFVVADAPLAAVVPGLTYLTVATVLALDGWRAGGLLIGIQSVLALVAVFADTHGTIVRTAKEQILITLLATAVHSPTLAWLISTSTRHLRTRQETAAREAAQEEKLRTVTDNASDSIVAFDDAGRIQFVNRTVSTMFGYEPTTLVGGSINRILPGFDARESPRERIVNGLHHDGNEVPLEVTVSRSPNSGLPLRVAVMRDISEKLGSVRRIEFQAALLDQVRTLVVASDLEGRLLYANANAAATLGLRPSRMRTTKLLDLVSDADRQDLRAVLVPAEGTWRGEVKLKAADGSDLPALVTLTRVLDSHGDPIGFGAVAADIATRKQTEERLSSLLASKDEFVTSVSHELRTPLTVIVGMAEELRRSFDDFAVDDVKDLIGVIADQSSELANIVQDLLVIGRSDAGGQLVIKPEPIDLDQELGTCVQLYVPSDRSARLSLDAILPVLADPFRLRQVVRNLLTNAVRYGGPDLRLEASQNTLFTTICVWDNGAGIPPDDVARIFDPYVRSKTGPALPGSMGLGLAVARKLSQLMGGELIYERRGEWSVFQITLPTARAEMAAALPA